MGSERVDEAEAPNPPHPVELSPYGLGVYPVTNAEYAAFVRATGAPVPAAFGHEYFGAPDQPVVGVGWREAQAYCEWAGGALPTEAQRELAARGFEGRRYPWGGAEPSEARACFAQDWNRGRPAPVGAHPAGVGPFGAHDLAGNVWEWCRDAWRADAHLVRPSLGPDPCVPGATRVRPLRGGCWRSIDRKLQGAYRNWSHGWRGTRRSAFACASPRARRARALRGRRAAPPRKYGARGLTLGRASRPAPRWARARASRVDARGAQLRSKKARSVSLPSTSSTIVSAPTWKGCSRKICSCSRSTVSIASRAPRRVRASTRTT